MALFDCIQTIDREKIARAVRTEMDRQGRTPRLYVQVNTGTESQKSGVAPAEVDALVEVCRGRYDLAVSGLMCLPPMNENPGPHFALLAKLAARLDLPDLSMGMSADFEIAVELGATHVRVGSAVFGPRG